ncbi:metal-dependent hydrolase [Thermococcus sp. 18S1]|uniref:metal-dependent hydrolase n=1 Tax=Thermococcus sp. 18S1 TaxID=1638210 RepID=UPI001439EC3F|nr:metal-dependent hydrolase [Thermococcus sp. 18S1]NJE30054.1 metal-dependent hydrolase [Thermococcus sp. 18S1]
MPNYDVHVLSGVVSYPVIVAAAGLAAAHGAPLALTTMALVLGYAFYVLGSDLPDMDHPNALIHRGTKPIVSVVVGGAVYVNAAGSINVGEPWLNTAVEWGIAVLAAVIAWFAFTWMMPKHRGIVHSFLFAAVYGGLAFVLVEYGLNMTTGEGLYVGFAAFSGYVLHLLLDGELSLL